MKKQALIVIFLTGIFCGVFAQENSLSTSELIVNSTIRIKCSGDTIINGNKVKFTSTGTGFFFRFQFDSLSVPVIVTNYHVIKSSKECNLVFTEVKSNEPQYGSQISETITNSEKKWIKHPKVDLAILPINPIIEDIKKLKNKTPFTVFFNENDLPHPELTESITAIEEVLMVGYPRGLWDKTNNLPIVRKGTTATPFYINYEGKKQFLLDIPIYSGSSGSPIVLFNQGSFSSRKGGLTIGTRLALLGINVQSWNFETKGELILPQPNRKIETKTKLPIDVAIIIKSEELLGFKPILKKLIQPTTK